MDLKRGRQGIFLGALALAWTLGPVRAAEPPLAGPLKDYLSAADDKQAADALAAFEKAAKSTKADRVAALIEAALQGQPLEGTAKLRYLKLASAYGPSQLFLKTARRTSLEGAPEEQAAALSALSAYFGKYATAHEADLPVWRQAVWAQWEQAELPHRRLWAGLLLVLDQAKALKVLGDGLDAGRWPDSGLELCQLMAERKDVPTEKVAGRLAKLMNSTGDLAQRRLIRQALDGVAGQARADQVFDAAPPLPPPPGLPNPEYENQPLERLLERPFTVDLYDEPIERSLQYLQQEYGMRFRVPSAADRLIRAPLKFTIHRLPLRRAIILMLHATGFQPQFGPQGMTIVPGAAPDTTTPEERQEIQARLAKPIDAKFSVQGADLTGWHARGAQENPNPLRDALNFLQGATGVEIVIHAAVPAQALQTPVKGLFLKRPAVTILNQIIAPAGLAWRFAHGKLEVYKK